MLFVRLNIRDIYSRTHGVGVMYATFGNYLVSLYRLECAYIVTLVDVTWKRWAAYLTTVVERCIHAPVE